MNTCITQFIHSFGITKNLSQFWHPNNFSSAIDTLCVEHSRSQNANRERGKKNSRKVSLTKKIFTSTFSNYFCIPSSKQFSHLIYRQYGSCTTGMPDLSNAIVAQDEMGRPFIIVRDQGKKENMGLKLQDHIFLQPDQWHLLLRHHWAPEVLIRS